MFKKILISAFLVALALSCGLVSYQASASDITGSVSTGIVSGSNNANGVVKAAPTASPAAGDYHDNQSVTLTASSATAICYTDDGATPSCANSSSCTTGTKYTTAISLTSSKTIKSVACYGDGSQGPAGSAAYTLTCSTATVSNGTVSAYPGCAITCNSGYTLSGSSCVSSGGSVIGGGGGGGTSQTPTTITTIGTTDSSTALTINSDQIGSLTQPLSDGSKIELTVPQGSVSSQTSFTATTGALSSDLTPLNTTGALMVGNQVFNVTAASNNVAVRSFSSNLTITLTVPNLPDTTSDLGVYYFNDTIKEWILIPGAVFNTVTDKVTFQVNHLTQFAVFKITGLTSTIKTASSPTTPTTPTTAPTTSTSIQQILDEAANVFAGKAELLASAMGLAASSNAEAAAEKKYTKSLVDTKVTAEARTAITNFITYGTPTTKILGAGERAGVVSSYKSAFGKVPSTAAEWSDVIKIANGRWPSVTSATAESKAKTEFKKVYKRAPNMKQANDNAAVTVIAYGLRPAKRNTNSETAAIKSFKATYGHAPVSALAWDIVRAIAYSGAKR